MMRKMIALVLMCGILPCAVANADVASMLKLTPAGTAEQKAELMQAIRAITATDVVELCAMLKPPGSDTDDTSPRMLVHAMAAELSRTGDEKPRAVLAKGLADVVGGDADATVKEFCLQQIRFVAGEDNIAAIAPALGDATLCESAAQALLSIGSARAAPAFRAALDKAEDPRRVTIIKALGELRDAASLPALIAATDSADLNIRLAACYALGNIGDARAEPVLARLAKGKPGYEAVELTRFYLLLGQRLTESGQGNTAASMLRTLMNTDGAPTHLRSAALATLAQAEGEKAFDDLLVAMNSDDVQLRAAARDIAASLPGQGVTARWVSQLEKAPPATQVEILAMLAQRGDELAYPGALECVTVEQHEVRLAAIAAAGQLGKAKAIGEMLGVLDSNRPAEARAAVDALMGMPADATVPMVEALATASPAGQVGLLNALAVRDARGHMDKILATAASDDAKVRLAAIAAMGNLADLADLAEAIALLRDEQSIQAREAIQNAIIATCLRSRDVAARAKPVLAAYPSAREPGKVALLRVMGQIGGTEPLNVVREAVSNDSKVIASVAMRALADWPDDAAAEDQFALAGKAPQPYNILALRGFIRTVGASSRPAEQKVGLLKQALESPVARTDEKRQALAQLGQVYNLPSLKLVEGYLADTELRAEAAAAVVRIAGRLASTSEDDAVAALNKVLDMATDARITTRASDTLSRIQRYADFIVDWKVAGPYRIKNRVGQEMFDEVFAPEKGDEGVEWRDQPVDRGNQAWSIDLQRSVGGDNGVAYLRTYVWSPVKRAARLEAGSDDGLKVWLNGKVVLAQNVLRGNKAGQDKVNIELVEGWNTLLLKVTNDGFDWATNARIRDAKGRQLRGIYASATKQKQ